MDRVHAVDLQAEMHTCYREKNLPENVSLVTADVSHLPFPDDACDAAVTTMTYHEFQSPDALAEVRRVLVPGGRFVVGDWTAAGAGEDGPPTDERYDLPTAREQLQKAGFSLDSGEERLETFLLVASVS